MSQVQHQQLVRSCNAINCIRNLPVKTQAPISAFSIERTCMYARDNACKVAFPWSNFFTPNPVKAAN